MIHTPTPHNHLLDVIFPIYNSGKFLEPAVASIAQQTFRGFRCLLCDASTDGSSSWLKDFVRNDARFILISQEKSNLACALQEGLQACTAPLVARMDADDISLPERFSHQIRALQASPDTLALGTSYRFMNAEGRLGRTVRTPRSSQIPKMLCDGSPLAHPTVMFRRREVLEVGGYRAGFDLAEDYDLWLRLSCKGRLDNLPQVLLYYRLHGNNSVVTQGLSNRQFTLLALASYLCQKTTGIDPITSGANLATVMAHLPEDERTLAQGHVMAACAHFTGDADEDPEGKQWQEDLRRLPCTDTVRSIFATYYMRLAKRYIASDKRKAAINFYKALQEQPAVVLRMCVKMISQYIK